MERDGLVKQDATTDYRESEFFHQYAYASLFAKAKPLASSAGTIIETSDPKRLQTG